MAVIRLSLDERSVVTVTKVSCLFEYAFIMPAMSLSSLSAILTLVVPLCRGSCSIGTLQGFMPYDCYSYSTELVSWQDAETRCEDVGGRLAAVGSSTYNSFFRNNLSNIEAATTYWTGGQFGSAWTWADGTAFSFTNWATGSGHPWLNAKAKSSYF